MIDEEIYVLTRHGRFSAEFVEKIPIYRRRFFLHLLEKEAERMEEEAEKASRKSQPHNLSQRPR